MDRETTERICYWCREMRGDRDDCKCHDCKNNIYMDEFYCDVTKEVTNNPNYIGNREVQA